MPPNGYCGAKFQNLITDNPITFLSAILVLIIGGLLFLHTWF